MPGSLIEWLNSVNRAVHDLEQQAAKILEKPDYNQPYRKLMLRKAGLLAGVSAEYRKLLKGRPELYNVEVAQRLGDFSRNAEVALKLDSLFYMSALLYPDEHKPGEPNNLELLIAQLH